MVLVAISTSIIIFCQFHYRIKCDGSVEPGAAKQKHLLVALPEQLRKSCGL